MPPPQWTSHFYHTTNSVGSIRLEWGLAQDSLTRGLPERKAQSENAQALAIDFLATEDVSVFDGASGLEMSYQDAERLSSILSDPGVQRILLTSLLPGRANQLENEKYWLFRIAWLLSIAGLGLILSSLLLDTKTGANVSKQTDIEN